MKGFQTRICSIRELLEWERDSQLQLSARFQRSSVWSDTARSYLMDSIVRGRPIPKVLMREKINPTTSRATKEVIDGRQRLRTILSYVQDGFQISKRHHPLYGGLYFSQLNTVDDTAQPHILSYEISLDILPDLPDSEILDIFARLNSYAPVLNEQEKISSSHFGLFKVLCDNIAHKHYEFWLDSKVFTEKEIVRMDDVSLTADLLIAMIEGIRSKKQIASFYDVYEKSFGYNPELLAERFDNVIAIISDLFAKRPKVSDFRKRHVFYSLFVSVYHLCYGVQGVNLTPRKIQSRDYGRVCDALDNIKEILIAEDVKQLAKDEAQFFVDIRRGAVDTEARARCVEFIANRISAFLDQAA